MRKSAVAVACAALFACGAYAYYPDATPQDSPAVMVQVKDGIGSGVSIGNGYILTARHVVDDLDSVTVKDDGHAVHKARVLWANKDYDVALLHIDDTNGIGAALLDCDANVVGEAVHTLGNPMGVDSITTWGRIAGKARKWGPWQSVAFTDLTIVPGNSGGGVYNDDGGVVGIAVGVMLTPSGKNLMGQIPSLTGVSAIVPASVICELLAC